MLTSSLGNIDGLFKVISLILDKGVETFLIPIHPILKLMNTP
jgi:hypothetical protein